MTTAVVSDGRIPLIVSLDKTLVKTDLVIESAFTYLASNPARLFAFLSALGRGGGALKALVSGDATIDAEHLPYDRAVLEIIQQAKADGRPVYLQAGSDRRTGRAVVERLGFDGLLGASKTAPDSPHSDLIEVFGARGFDYVGSSEQDPAAWSAARRRYAVHPSAAIKRRLTAMGAEAQVLVSSEGAPALRRWIKLLRVHQWAKNGLVFVPMLTAHHFDAATIAHGIVAFFAFSLLASAIYLVNDLVDIEADRKHPTKRLRPLAAGTIPLAQAILASPLLMVASFLLAATLGFGFSLVLVAYLGLTTAYSFWLKRKLLVDVVVLALLYTARVVAGGAAASIPISEWLLAFSMFIFMSLAMTKRYTELIARIDGQLPDPTNRNYRKADLSIIASLAGATGFNAVTVLALYISSDAVRALYRSPDFLWLVCPVTMYWIARMLMLAHRGEIDDDPILFAIRDRNSYLAFSLMLLVIVLAAVY
jgi:4-hydroxybenzoate polyprenyltransferase